MKFNGVGKGGGRGLGASEAGHLQYIFGVMKMCNFSVLPLLSRRQKNQCHKNKVQHSRDLVTTLPVDH